MKKYIVLTVLLAVTPVYHVLPRDRSNGKAPAAIAAILMITGLIYKKKVKKIYKVIRRALLGDPVYHYWGEMPKKKGVPNMASGNSAFDHRQHFST